MSLMTEFSNTKKISEFDDKSLLLVDDDNPFRERLARAMQKKGFEVIQADSVQKGINSLIFFILLNSGINLIW
jgi:two-component system response regulator RegA